MIGPYYTTADVADVVGASTAYVRREVALGRLGCARQIPRRGGRTAYRFTIDEVREYLTVYDPTRLPWLHVPRETSAPTATTA